MGVVRLHLAASNKRVCESGTAFRSVAVLQGLKDRSAQMRDGKEERCSCSRSWFRQLVLLLLLQLLLQGLIRRPIIWEGCTPTR